MRAETSSLSRPLDQTNARRTQKKPAAKKLPTQTPTAKKSAPRPAKKPVAPKPRSRAAEQARITQILDGLDALYPEAHCELDFHSPFELLVAVILSAQC